MTKCFINLYRKIFARRIFEKINLALFHASLRGLGIKNYENDKVNGERYLVTKILPKVIRNDSPVFFDVGANIGSYSIALLDCFPKAVIHAFEPHPRNYSRLKERGSSTNIIAHNVAMGETCGQLVLYDRVDHDGSSHASLHEGVITEIHKQETVKFEVSAETLDGFAEREGISHIDFIKIDTEGNELAVLKGASKMLEKGNIGCIHFEFNEMNIVSRVFFRDFTRILHNFELYRLLPSGLLHLGDSTLATELFAYQNIFALPKQSVPLVYPVR